MISKRIYVADVASWRRGVVAPLSRCPRKHHPYLVTGAAKWFRNKIDYCLSWICDLTLYRIYHLCIIYVLQYTIYIYYSMYMHYLHLMG